MHSIGWCDGGGGFSVGWARSISYGKSDVLVSRKGFGKEVWWKEETRELRGMRLLAERFAFRFWVGRGRFNARSMHGLAISDSYAVDSRLEAS